MADYKKTQAAWACGRGLVDGALSKIKMGRWGDGL